MSSLFVVPIAVGFDTTTSMTGVPEETSAPKKSD